jgi:hypothetical protein
LEAPAPFPLENFKTPPAPNTHLPTTNHNSRRNCAFPLTSWFEAEGRDKLTILDIGGGSGDKGDLLRSTNPAIDYRCIDVDPPSGAPCERFDGRHVKAANNSHDVVMFVYMLHHASGDAVQLLREAKRISRRYVLVLDDLTADTDLELLNQQGHEGCRWAQPSVCLFRPDHEYRSLFDVLGLRLTQSTVNTTELRNCNGDFVIPRGWYVLEV